MSKKKLPTAKELEIATCQDCGVDTPIYNLAYWDVLNFYCAAEKWEDILNNDCFCDSCMGRVI